MRFRGKIHGLIAFKYVLLLGVFIVCLFAANQTANATAGINKQINFQGRLLNSQGATVPDGFYNIEFKIYQDGDGLSVNNATGSPAGSLKWTEDYLNANTKGVMVKNGYLSVQLGSITPFGSSVDWNQDTIWLSMNIAGTDATCTPFASCSPDGEMTPMKRLSATPFALNSGLLNGLTSANFLQLAQGVQTDASTNTSSIFVNKTGTGNLIELQSGGVDALNITNAGDIVYGLNANHSLSVTTAGADTAGKSLTISSGSAGTGATTLAGGDLVLQGGAGGGTNGAGGNVAIDAGVKNGTGADGNINIGSINARTITVGNNTTAATQDINIGNSNIAGTTTNVVIGTGSSATAGTTTLQGKGNVGITSSNGSVSMTSSNGTMTLNSSSNITISNTSGTVGITGTGATTLSSSGSTLGLTGNGDASLTSTNGKITISGSNTVALGSVAADISLNSKTNTTISTNNIVRATFDTSNGLYLGNGASVGTPNAFTIFGSGNSTAGGTGAALTVQGGSGNTTGTGGAATFQGGTPGVSGIGGGATLKGANGGSTTGAGGTATVTGGTGGPSSAGGATTVSGGNGGTTAGIGGDLTLQGGAGTGTSNGGSVSIQGGSTGSGAVGAINIGTNNAATVQIGNTTLANTQTINIGTNNTAASVTNVTIGSGSNAGAASTTTVQSKGNITIASASGNVGISAAAGTMTISGYTATSLSSTTSSLSLTGNTDASLASTTGNTTVSSTAGYVSIASKTNTTISTNGATRATFDSSGNNLYLGSGVTGAVNPFTIMSTSGNAAAVAGSNLTIHSGTGGSTSAGGILTIQAGTGGSTSGAGGALNVQGGNATAGVSNGGDLNLNSGNKATTGTDGTINIGNLNNGAIQIGNNTGTQAINIGTASTGTANVTIGSTSGAAGGTTTIQGKGNVNVTSSSGNVGITATAGTMTISGNGATSLSSIAGTLSLAGYTDATLGSTTGNTSINSTAGTVGLNSKSDTTISTNSTVRATFDTANNLYLGNGLTAGAPTNFTISGTGSTTTAVSGGAITVQGGNATVGNANGGNVTISGGNGIGSGVDGLVVLTTPTFSTTANDANCFTGGALVAGAPNGAGTGISGCTFTSDSVNGSSAIIAGFSGTAQTATLPDPSYGTTTAAGRVIYITAANGTKDFTLSVNGGGVGNTISMRSNTTATMIWNGNDWTAAGASSSTTLQSAYDNTLTTAGGAELVLSNTANANGLTIRDNPTTPINGALLEVQTSTAGGLFSVNNNTTEYAKDGGGETGGGTSDANDATFPATTWSAAAAGGTITRTTTTINANAQISTGMAAISVVTAATANQGAVDRLSAILTQGMQYNVSFAAKLLNTSNSFQDLTVYYSTNGTTLSTPCTNYSSQTVQVSAWSKINCTFTVPANATATNSIIIVQNTGVAHTFYIDNVSVSLAANVNYATDGGVDDNINFGTNWTYVGSTVTVSQNAGVGNDRNTSAEVDALRVAGGGIKNKLSVNPFGGGTLYRITTYVSSLTTFNDFTIRYSPNAGTSFINCQDYNTQSIPASSNPSTFIKVTCYITTDNTAVTTPYIYFTQASAPAANRTFYIDTFSMSLSSNTVPNVQIGGGLAGSPLTLFTVDRGASAPIAANTDALLGSMYYDTTLGKLQCYEADGWGACGSSPDTVVTISPEYTNAVMHGTGVGTMTSDLCSDTLNINDGSGSPIAQPTICGTNETFNFYKWTSPQASAQTYSIYVTYQLPSTFKSFASGQTSLMARTDNGPSTGTGTVQYSIFRNTDGSVLAQCGNAITVATGNSTSWQSGITTGTNGASDPSACSFGAGDSIVFKIDMIANQNANAYVGNLNFIFTNK